MLNNVESICVWYGYDGQKYEWQHWMTAQFMMDDGWFGNWEWWCYWNTGYTIVSYPLITMFVCMERSTQM